MEDNTTADNFTCQISVFNTCHMEINKFLTDGTHHLGIYIGNDVKEVKRVMEILVYSGKKVLLVIFNQNIFDNSKF